MFANREIYSPNGLDNVAPAKLRIHMINTLTPFQSKTRFSKRDEANLKHEKKSSSTQLRMRKLVQIKKNN